MLLHEQATNKDMTDHIQIPSNICNRRWYNRDVDEIDQFTIRVDVNDGFDGMSLIIDIWIKMSIVIACSDISTNEFDTIDLNLDKVSEYECGHDNIDTVIIINTWYKIRAATITVGLFSATIYLIMEVVSGLPINITLSIEFDVIINAVNHLISILAVLSSIVAVDCNTQMVCNACVVFFIFFHFFFFFHFCECINVVS